MYIANRWRWLFVFNIEGVATVVDKLYPTSFRRLLDELEHDGAIRNLGLLVDTGFFQRDFDANCGLITYLFVGGTFNREQVFGDVKLQWNLDLTKCQGTGEICSLYRG